MSKRANGIDEISQSLGRIEQKIDDLRSQMVDVSENGCKFGRNTDKSLSNHITGHRVVYVVMTALATIAAWALSNFGRLK